MDDNSTWWLHLFSIGFVNISFALLVGGVTFLWLLRFARTTWAAACAETVAAVLRGATLAALAGAMLVLWTQTAEISEQPMWSAVDRLGTVVTRTHVGHAWAVGAVALLSLAIVVLARNPLGIGCRATPWMATCLAVYAGSRSWASHAEAAGGFVAFAIDMLHLLSTSLWAGLVFLSARIGLNTPSLSSMAERRECASYVNTLSVTATRALAVVALTGASSSWRSIDITAAPNLSTPYVALLIGKVILVAFAVVLGGCNRWGVMPRLLGTLRKRKQPFEIPLEHFRKILRVESLILLVVLMLAAALSITPLPGH